MAGVTMVFGVWRFGLVPADLYKVVVRSSFMAAGSC
jgi:hypothetical protein